MSRGSGIGAGPGGKSRLARRSRTAVVTFAAMCASLAVLPAWAEAHGPVAPIATSYLARIALLPGGLAAKVIDGDQRLWLRVPAGDTVVVQDYRGAPYLRFSRAGVAVNRDSPMYYLNQTPAEIPPSNSEDGVRRPARSLTYPRTDLLVSFLGPVGFGLVAADRPYGAVGSGGVTS